MPLGDSRGSVVPKPWLSPKKNSSITNKPLRIRVRILASAVLADVRFLQVALFFLVAKEWGSSLKVQRILARRTKRFEPPVFQALQLHYFLARKTQTSARVFVVPSFSRNTAHLQSAAIPSQQHSRLELALTLQISNATKFISFPLNFVKNLE